MSSKRMFFLLNGVVVLLVAVLIGGAYEIDQVLTKQSVELVKQRSQLAALDSESSALVVAKKEVKQYDSLATIAKSIVPQDKDQAQTVREIVKIAGANGIPLGAISFPSSTLGSALGGGNTKGLNLSQLKAVPGLSGVYNLEIIVQSRTGSPVNYAELHNFLRGLEHNRRTALVSSITLTPDSKDPKLIAFSLTLDEYIKP